MLDAGSHASAYERCSPARQVEILRLVKAQLQQARRDPAVFIESCAKAEHGKQQQIRLAPHQRLLLRFAQQFKNSVVRMPHGSSKTFLLTFFGLWMLGRDLTSRGAIVCAGASQAQQPLNFMRQQIESGALRAVFPELQRSTDPHDPWTQAKITVERPGILRDPSVKAIGIDGKIQGARIAWILADDILDGDNTLTKESRDVVERDFEARILGRLDRMTGRCCVTNTPWDQDDLTFRLVARDWPLIAMNVDGFIWFENVGDPMQHFGDLIRPSRTQPNRYRMRAFDPDPDEMQTLWPGQMPRRWVEVMRGTIKDPSIGMAKTPYDFARFLMCEPFDAGSSRCLKAWVDRAFELGAGMKFPAERTGAAPTFTGVDYGGVDRHHDMSSILTFELLSNGCRRILNLQTGHWTGASLIERISREAELYDPVITVESNGAQKLLVEFAQLHNLSARIKKFDTGKNKYDEAFGVEAVFTEMCNELWIWPDGGVHDADPLLEQLGKECLFYDPAKHTPDQLMALFLARQGLSRYRSKEARKGSAGKPVMQFAGGGL